MENQDPNQITPSTPEQVQVVQPPTVPVAPDQAASVTSAAEEPTPPAPTGYSAFTDDEFKNAYAELCTQMGREFGIRHDLITVNGVTDMTKFSNVLVVAKKE